MPVIIDREELNGLASLDYEKWWVPDLCRNFTNNSTIDYEWESNGILNSLV